jgi:hypothetical protein
VLDFRRHRRALAHPGPALERRMLMMLVGIGIVVLLIFGAGNPSNWHWLAPPDNGASELQRVQPQQQVVVSLADEDDADVPPAGVVSSEPTPTGVRPYFPGVRPDYLSLVRDDTVFRPAESDGWFHLFVLLATTPADELTRASEGRVGTLQLSQQPKEYRGRLVTVSGVARAAQLVEAPRNAFGVKQYYQLWLQPNRAAGELIVLYSLELPDGFPLGDEIDATCAATGFFFKRWAYASQGGITTAPLVIAKTVDWQPAPAAPPAPEQPLSERVMTAAIVAGVLAAIALVFMTWRMRGAARLLRAGGASASDASVAATLASLDEEAGYQDRAP